VALCGSGAQAGKSQQRQVGEGVEAGVEMDVEVPGTRAELVAVSAWDTSDVAAGEEQDEGGWPVVGFERRPTVQGGGPSPGGARGGWLGVVRPTVAGMEARGVAAWQR
jgi:hypothetical protein